MTTLGDNAFASCTSLRKVTFYGYVDETLTLGYEPFIFCPLEELVIYRNLDYFDVPFHEHKIRSVEFGEGVTTIPHKLLEHCETLTNVKLPSTLTTIGEAAFKNCTGLTDIPLPLPSGKHRQRSLQRMHRTDGNPHTQKPDRDGRRCIRRL